MLFFFFLLFSDIFSSAFACSGACEHRQRDVFRSAGSRRLRRLLQPPGGPRPLLHHGLQLLRGDPCGDLSPDPEGHLVSARGAAAAYCVELLPSTSINPTPLCTGQRHFIFLKAAFCRSLDEACFSDECFLMCLATQHLITWMSTKSL